MFMFSEYLRWYSLPKLRNILRSIQRFWLYGLVDHSINPAKQQEDHQIIRLSGASTWLKSWPRAVSCNSSPAIDRRMPVLAMDWTYRRDSERTTGIHVASSSSSFAPQDHHWPWKRFDSQNEGWIVSVDVFVDLWCGCEQLTHVDICKSATRLSGRLPRCGREWIVVTTNVAEYVYVVSLGCPITLEYIYI